MAAGEESGGSAGSGCLPSLGELVAERAWAPLPLLFPRLPVKPESWDQRLKQLVAGSALGWEMVPATGDAPEGCARAGLCPARRVPTGAPLLPTGSLSAAGCLLALRGPMPLLGSLLGSGQERL